MILQLFVWSYCLWLPLQVFCIFKKNSEKKKGKKSSAISCFSQNRLQPDGD